MVNAWVIYLFYKNSIQEKAIRLNVQKLRAALLTEGDLVEEGLVSQAEENGLISLAKAIISQSDEKASLESELERLRTLRDQSDFILPERDSLEGPPEEKTQIQPDKPAQLEKAETAKPTLPQLPEVKRPAAKERGKTAVLTQLALF